MLDKFRNLNLYTYTYKKNFEFNENINDEDFITKYIKLKKLETGFLSNELVEFSQKWTCDYINDDDYIKSIIGEKIYNEKQELIKIANDKINENKNNMSGFDYWIIYKYNVVATKELINKYDNLEAKYNLLEKKYNDIILFINNKFNI